MYSKPEVRIIQDQQIDSNPVNVTSSEAADILAKYGYSSQQYNTFSNTQKEEGLTAEEMYAQYDREIEMKLQQERQRRYGPKAITFDSNNINYSSNDYRSLEDGFGVQVQIVSDMPIYNNRRY